jgi:NAD(P)-dependent dehydrogenase (short-subunit alcohol dehydrogenase family)
VTRTVLVVGAAGGVGAACAELFAAEGCAVALADRDAAGVRALAGRLGERGLAIEGDVARVADCERMVGEAAAWHGRLDVLVNCAGVWTEGPSDEVDEETWDRVVDINLKGTFFTCRHAIAHLERTRGCIVNISSDAGLVGNKGAAVYCASKGGVTLLTRSLAVELAARGVRVNAICPGDVDTPMIEYQAQTYGGGDPDGYKRSLLEAYPQGERARFIRPEEVARLVAFVASPGAEPITGAALSIDFGITAGY